jgi:hypothetical protein
VIRFDVIIREGYRIAGRIMKVALGFKAHSGWAALVCVGGETGELQVTQRTRIELVEPDAMWAKQPYHAAEMLESKDACDLVTRATEHVRRVAVRQLREIVSQCKVSGYELAGCAVLTPQRMPAWSTTDILAVHFRMHKAEGVLFPDALCRAAEACSVAFVPVSENQLHTLAKDILGAPLDRVLERVTTLGKSSGAPWGRDQKLATVAALIALRTPRLK